MLATTGSMWSEVIATSNETPLQIVNRHILLDDPPLVILGKARLARLRRGRTPPYPSLLTRRTFVEETQTTGDLEPAVSARITPQDAQYPVLMQRLFAKNETLFEDNRKLEVQDQVKASLMTNVGNELRSPISAIVGLSALLSEGALGELNARQHDCVQSILSGSETMLRTLADLLVFTRIEAETFELERSRVSLGDLVHACVRRLRPRIDAKSQQIEVTLDPSIPELHADAERLHQAIGNLLDNAHTFTPAGGRLRVHGRRAGAEIVLEIIDSGPGIPEIERQHLLDGHVQIRAQHQRRTGSSGLGLAVTQAIVERHGGSLGLESALGIGSTFSIHLPL